MRFILSERVGTGKISLHKMLLVICQRVLEFILRITSFKKFCDPFVSCLHTGIISFKPWAVSGKYLCTPGTHRRILHSQVPKQEYFSPGFQYPAALRLKSDGVELMKCLSDSPVINKSIRQRRVFRQPINGMKARSWLVKLPVPEPISGIAEVGA